MNLMIYYISFLLAGMLFTFYVSRAILLEDLLWPKIFFITHPIATKLKQINFNDIREAGSAYIVKTKAGALTIYEDAIRKDCVSILKGAYASQCYRIIDSIYKKGTKDLQKRETRETIKELFK